MWDRKNPKYNCVTFFPNFFSHYFIPLSKKSETSSIFSNNNDDKNVNVIDNNNVNNSVNNYVNNIANNNRRKHSELIQNDDDEEDTWSAKINPLINNESGIYSNNTSHRNSRKEINTNVNEIELLQTNSDKFYYILQKTKYFLSTCLGLSCLVFVGLCLFKGYSSFEAPVPTQIAIAAGALFVVFYCEGKS